MALLNYPYKDKFSPYQFAKKNNADWIDKIKGEIQPVISAMEKQLMDEAEFCHDTELLDPKNMYCRFKENCEHNTFMGNWVILKYFSRMLKIKLLKEMLGEWTYTKEDKEMYEYYRSINVNYKNRISPRSLDYKSGIEDKCENSFLKYASSKPIYLDFPTNDKADTHNVLCVDYYDLFTYKLHSIDDMVKRAKMRPLTVDNYDMFGKDCFLCRAVATYIERYGSMPVNYSLQPISCMFFRERNKPKPITKEMYYNAALEYIEHDRQYNIMMAELQRYKQQLIDKFNKTKKGKEMYELLPEEYKKEGV